jgi:DNA-binding PadR family transcriptional regulator
MVRMRIDQWRGAGAKKFRIIEAIETDALTADQIWRRVQPHGVGYGVISQSLNLARRTGLVERHGVPMRYRYRATSAGREYLAATRKRFQKEDD